MQIGEYDPMADRRAARRYDLSLPITVWSNASDPIFIHAGRTRAISVRGVYFNLGRTLSCGTALGFALTLPTELTGNPDIFVRGLLKVSRVDEHGEDDFGIAAVFERYEISKSIRSTI